MPEHKLRARLSLWFGRGWVGGGVWCCGVGGGVVVHCGSPPFPHSPGKLLVGKASASPGLWGKGAMVWCLRVWWFVGFGLVFEGVVLWEGGQPISFSSELLQRGVHSPYLHIFDY